MSWLAVAAGNTRTRIAAMRGGEVLQSVVITNTDLGSVGSQLAPLKTALADLTTVVSTTVNNEALKPISSAVREVFAPPNEFRIGVDIPIPLRHTLDDASTLGHDRALNAVAAFARAGQAVVVVDVGTATTVDFIDGEGVFQGGAIAPGAAMMLSALHRGTAALPDLAFSLADPARGAFGRDTAHAMMLGAAAAVRGVFRELLDRYAEAYGGYPQVIGTGGDIGLLEETGLVEHVVPDLQILGMAQSLRASIEDDDGDQSLEAPGNA